MIVNNQFQTTLNSKVKFSGISLHKGIMSNLTIKPSEEDTGIVFKRIDKFENNLIQAKYNFVSNTIMCTKLSNEFNLSVSTVEHLMAAFIGFGVDNALVEVDCSELPILDGSSSKYIQAFKKIGLKYLDSHKKIVNVLRKVSIIENDRFITSGGMGAMGFGLPAAIGTAFNSEHKEVVLITGDGSFQVNIQELETIKRLGKDVSIFVNKIGWYAECYMCVYTHTY